MSYQIVIKSTEPQPIVAIRRTIPISQISATLAELLPAAWAYISAHGALPSGMPFTCYHRFGENEVELEAGLPTAVLLQGDATHICREIAGGKVVSTIHQGGYDTLNLAHQALHTWLRENQLQAAGPLREIYITDPGQVPDPAEWKTEVVCPIQEQQ